VSADRTARGRRGDARRCETPSFFPRQLAEAERPLDLVLVGLGFMGYGLLRRLSQVKGVRVPLLITREVPRALELLGAKGIPAAVTSALRAIRANAERGILSVWSSPDILSAVPFPIVVETTGEVAYGTEVALAAFDSGKHVVTLNVELHVTLGTYLKRYAEERGLVFTDAEGDQPGTLASLMEEVIAMGFKPVLAGNMKGYLDRAATPDSIRAWSEQYGLNPKQTAAFTDGTKLAIEMALVANYFGMKVLTRGMFGPRVERVQDALTLFDWDAIPDAGAVDYVIGRTLEPGVFVVGEFPDPEQANYLRYLKLGDGPRYLLYRPHHLCHLEVMATVARVAVLAEATIDNGPAPTTQVIACAKRDIVPGEEIDGLGGYTCYGLVENLEVVRAEALAPIGLLPGAVARRRLSKDEPIAVGDVDLPENAATRLCRRAEILPT
jgi:predicted homoserine dehydrogenase-like protein